MILQGEVYWAGLPVPAGSEPGYRRPCVIVQNDWLNRSAIRTVVICVITSNMARSTDPGNVPLRRGEGGLPRPSVVNVSQIQTIDKVVLVSRIGILDRPRLNEIIDGVKLILEPR